MGIDKRRARGNVDYAKHWFSRAVRDFNLFKKLVPFDRRVNKPVRCSDPSLAVYLLQQCVEKAIKAVAVASGQYIAKDFVGFYRHNSLALIIDLNIKLVAKIKELGLDSAAALMGIGLTDAESKLEHLKGQVLGDIPLISREGKKVSFKSESMGVKPEVIDQILNSSILARKKILDIIRATFSLLPGMGMRKGQSTIGNANEFVKELNEELTRRLNINPLSEAQLQGAIEFGKVVESLGFGAASDINRRNMTANYLAVWEFSYALLWLSYITFAHESSSRYPLRQRGDISAGRLGCDDYSKGLGIVDRIGQIGYATSLTLNEMKNEIETVALLFAANRP